MMENVDFFAMFVKALEGNNLIVIGIVAALVIVQQYLNSRTAKNTDAILAEIANNSKRLDENFANDLLIKTSLEANSEEDRKQAIRIENIENQLADIYEKVTGKEMEKTE